MFTKQKSCAIIYKIIDSIGNDTAQFEISESASCKGILITNGSIINGYVGNSIIIQGMFVDENDAAYAA